MRSRLAFALVFVAAVASADAPANQYDQFSPQAQTITDHFARLDWQRILTLPMVDYTTALGACMSPQRLPTYRELFTIVDEDPHKEWDPEAGAESDRYIDPNAFPGTPAGPFWSMSPGTAPGTVKVVDFERGESVDSELVGNPKTLGWVRCVTDRVP